MPAPGGAVLGSIIRLEIRFHSSDNGTVRYHCCETWNWAGNWTHKRGRKWVPKASPCLEVQSPIVRSLFPPKQINTFRRPGVGSRAPQPSSQTASQRKSTGPGRVLDLADSFPASSGSRLHPGPQQSPNAIAGLSRGHLCDRPESREPRSRKEASRLRRRAPKHHRDRRRAMTAKQ